MQVLGFIFLALIVITLLFAVGLLIASAGDIQRYRQIKKM